MQTRETPENDFGWADLIAAVCVVALSALLAPSAAHAAQLQPASAAESDDWNFLWVAPTTPEIDSFAVTLSDTASLIPLTSQHFDPVSTASTPALVAPNTTPSTLGSKVELQPVAVRFAPPTDSNLGGRTSIAIREDRWTMIDVDGVARVSAYARGPLDAEDWAQAQSPTTFPRALGTGVSFVTETPVYVGATLKTDRSVYDIDMNRFRGAQWSKSIFVGTNTSFGPLSIGTTQDPRGERAAYLYLGRWF
jgi:hypothetical protein